MQLKNKSPSIEELDGVCIDGLKFCTIVYDIFDSIRAKNNGIKSLRQQSSRIEKKLLEELIPISRYIQTYYRPGRRISVTWKNGNQLFDAEIHQHGDYISHGYYSPHAFLEITCAMHENEHLTWNMPISYAAEGIKKTKHKSVESEPVVFSNLDHVNNFASIVESAIRKKTTRRDPYPDKTSLVVQCYLNSIYMPNEWIELIRKVEESIPVVQFQEILLVDSLTERSTSLAISR